MLILVLSLFIGTGLSAKLYATTSTWTDSNTIVTNNFTLLYKNVANYSQSDVNYTIDSEVMKRARVEAVPAAQGISHRQGDTVYFNHILKNIGNASDTFYFDSGSVHNWAIEIIRDSNQDGTWQSSETQVLSVTPSVVKNDTYSFFVRIYIPPSAADAEIDTETVNIISGYKYPDTFTITDTVTVDSPPSAPTGLAAQFIDTYIRLTWKANSETDVIGYNVYKSTNGGAYSRLNGNVVNDTQFNDTQLVFPNNYIYKITAVDAIQQSAFSDSASAPYLTLVKTANLSETQPGNYVTYSLDIVNKGYAPATNIVLTDTLPAYTTFDTAAKYTAADTISYSDSGAQWSGSPDTITVHLVRWRSGINLNSGDTAEYELKVRIKW